MAANWCSPLISYQPIDRNGSGARPVPGRSAPAGRKILESRIAARHGGSNPLNTALAKRPRVCLEYIIVHKLVHLLKPTHNARFVALMHKFTPSWQSHRQSWYRLPVRHERWDSKLAL